MVNVNNSRSKLLQAHSFPAALPRHLLKRMLTFPVAALYLNRKKSHSRTNFNFKSSLQTGRNSLRAINPEVIRFPSCAQLTDLPSRLAFHISIWPTAQSAVFAFVKRSETSVLHCLWLLPRTDPHVWPSSVQMSSPERGTRQSCSPQHRKLGPVLSCPPSSMRDGLSDVS